MECQEHLTETDLKENRLVWKLKYYEKNRKLILVFKVYQHLSDPFLIVKIFFEFFT